MLICNTRAIYRFRFTWPISVNISFESNGIYHKEHNLIEFPSIIIQRNMFEEINERQNSNIKVKSDWIEKEYHKIELRKNIYIKRYISVCIYFKTFLNSCHVLGSSIWWSYIFIFFGYRGVVLYCYIISIFYIRSSCKCSNIIGCCRIIRFRPILLRHFVKHGFYQNEFKRSHIIYDI